MKASAITDRRSSRLTMCRGGARLLPRLQAAFARVVTRAAMRRMMCGAVPRGSLGVWLTLFVSCAALPRVWRLTFFVSCAACACIPVARAQDAEPFERAPRGLEDSELADKPRQNDRALAADELARLLARYAHEPSVSEVVAAALQAERRNPRRFDAMARRARLRGLIPNVDLGVRRGQGLVLRSTTSDETASLPTTDDDLMLFATLRFDLGRLLFTSEEVTISREARFADQARREVVRQVVHLYFLRRRLLLERDVRDASDISHELRISEAEALLDAFTDGAFERMLRAARTRWKTAARTNVSAQP